MNHYESELTLLLFGVLIIWVAFMIRELTGRLHPDERDYTFKPLKDYADLSVSALVEEWLNTPADSLQRVFIYQAMKKMPDFFQTNENEHHQTSLRNMEEKKTFKLRNNEVLIYCLSDIIHHTAWRTILGSLFLFPFLIWLGFIFLIKDIPISADMYLDYYVKLFMFVCGMFWFPTCWLIRKLKIFKSKIFITNLRLGCCLTVFGKFNFSFDFLDYAQKLILADFRIVLPDIPKLTRKPGSWHFGLYTPKRVSVAIWQINNDTCRSYFFYPYSMISFLECLIALINESGGCIYIPEFIELGEQANGAMGVVNAHQFTGGDLNALKEWYAKARRLIASITPASNSHLKTLLEMANYIDLKQAPDVQFEYDALKRQIDEKLSFFTKIRPPGFLYTGTVSGYYLCFTDKGLISADKQLKAVRCFCRYSDIRLNRSPYSVKLYSRDKCFGEIQFFGSARFPVIETLSLLGCARPNESGLAFGMGYLTGW